MKINYVLITILTLFCLYSAKAENSQDCVSTDSDSIRTLSMDECVEMGLANNYDIRILEKRIELLKHENAMLRCDKKPSLRTRLYSENYTEAKEQDVNYNKLVLEAEQLLFDGGKLKNRIAILDTEIDKLEKERIILSKKTAYKIRKHYCLIKKQTEKHAAVKRLLGRWGEMRGELEKRFSERTITRLELVRVTGRIIAAKRELLAIDKSIEREKTTLKMLLALTTDEIILEDSFDFLILETVPSFSPEDMQFLPEIQKISLDIKSRELAIKAAKGYYAPELTAAADAGVVGRDELTPAAGIRLTFDWDIWRWGKNSERVRAAQSELETSLLRLEKAKLYFENEIDRQYFEIDTCSKEIELSIEGVSLYKDAPKDALALFREGRYIATDVMEIDEEFKRIKLAEIDAKYARYTAILRLKKLIDRENK